MGEVRSHPQIVAHATAAPVRQVPWWVKLADVHAWAKLAFAALAIFGGAALIRALTIALVTGANEASLGWFMDSFHHWQVAYLSKEIGFREGFLRLWDLKGMEYFWGLMHPLVLAGLFSITGSIDILVPRMMTLVAGSTSIVALFFLARRYFGVSVAVATVLLAAVSPAVVLSDVSGLQEPLGITILLVGLLFWPSQPIAAGICLGLAGMVRAEYWVFGIGLALAAIVMQRRSYSSWGLALGWAIPSLLYMKYLLDYTGNPIYPVYWYFLGDAAGHWMGEGSQSQAVLLATWTSRILLPALLAAAIWVLIKKPKHSLLFLLGLGELIFLAIVFGFSAFGRGFVPRLLLGRIFLLPHLSFAFVASALFLGWLPARLRTRMTPYLGWLAIGGIAIGLQGLWVPILQEYAPWRPTWERHFAAADEIADFYQGGVVSLPEDRPEFTYILARNHSIPANRIDGQMYDPFAYIEGDPFLNWPETEERLAEWLVEDEISLLVFYPGKSHYKEMISRMTGWFEPAGEVLGGTIEVYRVHPPAELEAEYGRWSQ